MVCVIADEVAPEITGDAETERLTIDDVAFD